MKIQCTNVLKSTTCSVLDDIAYARLYYCIRSYKAVKIHCTRSRSKPKTSQVEGSIMVKNITIFTTTTCAYCPMVKKYLGAKGFTYDEVNLDTNPERQQEALALSG